MKKSRTVRIAREALRALDRHRFRNGLAVLGMVIGVAAVVIMVAIGRGVQNRVIRDMERLGTDLLIVAAGEARFRGARPRPAKQVRTLKFEDAQALERSLPAVLKAVPLESRNWQVKPSQSSVASGQGYSSSDTTVSNTTVTGTTASFTDVLGYEIYRGRSFSEYEVKRLKKVAVVGPTLSENLFGDNFPVGRQVLVGKVPFTIIGIYKSRGLDAFGDDQDDQMFVPFTTMIRRILHQEHLTSIILQIAPGNLSVDLKNEVRGLLRERHRLQQISQPDDFTVKTQAELMATKKKTSRTFAILIASVAAISILVAGVGILAVMLISIQERTTEIGLRRALGANRSDLLYQFLLEALALGSVGGGGGALLGLVSAFILRAITPLQFALPLSLALMSAVLAMLISLIFGVIPARRAAKLDPVVALAAA
jgi:putative ABC transport system permease protein